MVSYSYQYTVGEPFGVIFPVTAAFEFETTPAAPVVTTGAVGVPLVVVVVTVPVVPEEASPVVPEVTPDAVSVAVEGVEPPGVP